MLHKYDGMEYGEIFREQEKDLKKFRTDLEHTLKTQTRLMNRIDILERINKEALSVIADYMIADNIDNTSSATILKMSKHLCQLVENIE